MITIEVQIPEAVFNQAQEIARHENIPLTQVISMAVTQAVGVWSNEKYVEQRTKMTNRERFLEALQRTLDGNHHKAERQVPPSPDGK
jgi:hypothetical protein